MNVELIAMTQRMDGQPAMQTLEEAAGVCVGRGASQHGLRSALKSGHDSLLEHVSFTFRIEDISRVTLAQLTRHRIASYSVMSQRYVNQDRAECVTPPSIKINHQALFAYEDALDAARKVYEDLIAAGVAPEDARYILPESTCTSLILTMNARELGHFFTLRMCNRAQWEIRHLAQRMWAICCTKLPEIFGMAGPACKRGPCPEANPCRVQNHEDYEEE